MSRSDIAIREKSQRARLPRWAGLILSIVLAAAGHVAVPWGYSLLTARHGWVQERPGRWNVVGLSLVGPGIAGLLWCLGLHFARAPQTVELTYIFPSLSWRRHVGESRGKLGGRSTDQEDAGKASESAPSSVVMEGPYQFSRHPMYLCIGHLAGMGALLRKRRGLHRLGGDVGGHGPLCRPIGGARAEGTLRRELSAVQEQGATLGWARLEARGRTFHLTQSGSPSTAWKGLSHYPSISFLQASGLPPKWSTADHSMDMI